jgi:hypothetical protein
MAQEYLEVKMEGQVAAGGSNAKIFVNLYHFRRSNTALPISKSNINAAFQTAIGDVVLLALQADYTQAFNYIRFFDDALDWAAPFVQTGTGAIGTVRSPDYACATVRLKAAINSRSGRGSKHFGPIAEADTDGDVLTAGAITRFDAVGAAILAGFTDADSNIWSPVLKSSKFGAQYAINPVTVVAFPIMLTRTNPTLGTMRRRKAKSI